MAEKPLAMTLEQLEAVRQAIVGVHALDLIRWTTGEEFVEVTAYQGNTGHPEAGDMEDQAVLALRLSGGGSADVRLDYCRPQAAPAHGDDRLRVAGSSGVAEAMGGKVVLITQEARTGERIRGLRGRLEDLEAVRGAAGGCVQDHRGRA